MKKLLSFILLLISINSIGQQTAPGSRTGDTVIHNGFARFPNTPAGLGTKAVRMDASGKLFIADTTIGGGASLSSITAATTSASINSAGNPIVWAWNGNPNGPAMTFSSTSTTLPAANTNSILYLASSGTNGTASVTRTGLTVELINAGTTSTNTGISITTSGATNNYGIIVNTGRVGIGTPTPTSLLHLIDASTTGIGAAFSSSTLTSGTLMDLTRTGTVAAANNEVLNISSSGANGTNAITATGARISVTNTNATSGTNTALNLTASGATTDNIALDATGQGKFTGQYYSVSFALTDGATIALDWNNGNCQTVTLAGNRTFTFANPKAGARYMISLTQDGTGTRTITWPTIRWRGGAAPTLTTTLNKTDLIFITWNGTDYFGEASLNY